jgi:hypothetical protein
MAFIIVLPGREGSLQPAVPDAVGCFHIRLKAHFIVRRCIGRPQKRKRGEWYQLAIKNP